jgi:hypothetical protein
MNVLHVERDTEDHLPQCHGILWKKKTVYLFALIDLTLLSIVVSKFFLRFLIFNFPFIHPLPPKKLLLPIFPPSKSKGGIFPQI